jgi:hypothetical protein
MVKRYRLSEAAWTLTERPGVVAETQLLLSVSSERWRFVDLPVEELSDKLDDSSLPSSSSSLILTITPSGKEREINQKPK